MKDELIKLALQKDFLFIVDSYYLWMCELQKWLRDKHNIHININTELDDGNIEYGVDIYTIDRKNFNCEYVGIDYTFDKVLEKGLFEALKLIK